MTTTKTLLGSLAAAAVLVLATIDLHVDWQ
jgi:hypothetical protein